MDVNVMEVIRKTPCAPCAAEYMGGAECWNYGKEPDPENPDGPWKIVGWFHCRRGIVETEAVKPPTP